MTPAFGFGVHAALVEVDRETGKVDVKQMWTAHDCGTVINPKGVEGQLAGSIQMGLGYALLSGFFNLRYPLILIFSTTSRFPRFSKKHPIYCAFFPLTHK